MTTGEISSGVMHALRAHSGRIRIDHNCIAKIGLAQIRVDEFRIAEHGSLQDGPTEPSTTETCSLEIRILQSRTAEIRLAEINTNQMGTPQISPAQIAATAFAFGLKLYHRIHLDRNRNSSESGRRETEPNEQQPGSQPRQVKTIHELRASISFIDTQTVDCSPSRQKPLR